MQVVQAFTLRRLEFEVDAVPLAFQGLPLRKVVNWFLTESSAFARPSAPWGLPTIVQVEPASFCNLECPGCPAGGEIGRDRGFMDLNLYTSLIDELADSLLVVLFWDWGEPFLNPRAYDMVEYAARTGIKVLASSNGLVFAEGDHARRLVESGLDTLTVGIDGLEQRTYERFRRGGKLEKVVEGIRRLREERARHGSETPRINVRFIVMRHNEHELADLDRFATRLGADMVTERRFARWGRVDELNPSHPDFAMPSPSSAPAGTRPLRRNPCRALWNCPTVHWDGSVCSCFMDWDGAHPLGKLGKQSLREIWHGDAYRRLRRTFRGPWRDLQTCSSCSCGYEGGDVGTESNLRLRVTSLGAADRGGE